MKPKAPWTRAFPAQVRKPAAKKLRIRPVSQRQSKRLAEYRRKRDAWLVGKVCDVCFVREVECHHTRGRAGSLLLDERYWMPICHYHHEIVKYEPEWARSVGLLCQPGEWNKP